MASNVIYEPIEEFGLSKKEKSTTLFSKIGIVGCGLVGQNIARIASFHGIEVVFIEISDKKIQEAYTGIEKVLDQRIAHWGITDGEKRAILSRIKGTMNYDDLASCDFVVEAIRANNRGNRIIERKNIFNKIEAIVNPACIIATNSTNVVLAELIEDMQHKGRCISLHFLISSSEARIVELVRGLNTSDSTYNKVCQFVTLLNRKVVPVIDSAGLVSVRMFVSSLNEACEILMEGIASLEDINMTMKIGYGMRMGPFEIADKIGLDKIVYWMNNMFKEFGKQKYKPSPIIHRMIRANHLGIETGEGFFKYDKKGNRIIENSEDCQ